MNKTHDDDIKCNGCGEWFYPGDLGLVFWHEDHKGEKPTEPSPYKSKRMNPTEVKGVKFDE